jgi:hypothetical protein
MTRRSLIVLAALSLAACVRGTVSRTGSTDNEFNGKFKSAQQNSDGTWSVVCPDGTSETDSADAFAHGQICQRAAAPNVSDPFDPASCSGATLTVDQALNYLNIPAGQLDVKIGRFSTARRWRSCYPTFPCSDWQTAGASDVASTGPVSQMSYSADGGGSVKVALAGEIHVDFDSNQPRLALYGDVTSFTDRNNEASTVTFLIDDWDFTGSTIPAPVYTAVDTTDTDGDSRMVPTFNGQAFAFQSATATGTCVRLMNDTKQNATDKDSNNYVIENQLVVFGPYGN